MAQEHLRWDALPDTITIRWESNTGPLFCVHDIDRNKSAEMFEFCCLELSIFIPTLHLGSENTELEMNFYNKVDV